jgi:hypothetical protein
MLRVRIFMSDGEIVVVRGNSEMDPSSREDWTSE